MTRELQWREVDVPALNQALSSGQTYYVPPELMPDWAQGLKTVSGVWLHYHRGQPAGSTVSLSTSQAQARLDIERFDPTDAGLLKYDRYYFIKMVDQRVFQIGPFKNVDYGHHLRERPRWALDYSSESASL